MKSVSCQNIINGNDNDILIKNLIGKALPPIKLKMQRLNEINYLDELKKERKNKNENEEQNNNWNKAMQNINEMIKKNRSYKRKISKRKKGGITLIEI